MSPACASSSNGEPRRGGERQLRLARAGDLALLPSMTRRTLLVIPSRAELLMIPVAVNGQLALRARPHEFARLLPRLWRAAIIAVAYARPGDRRDRLRVLSHRRPRESRRYRVRGRCGPRIHGHLSESAS